MNVAYQIAISGAAIFTLIWGYSYVADVAGIRTPEWVARWLGLFFMAAGAAAVLGVLVGVWL